MDNRHYHDIFYDIYNLSFKKKVQLLREAKELCYEWWADILDCDKSWSREKIEISFEEAMKKCDKETHFVFIHRRGYKNWDWRLEIGYRSMTTPDYFLWIEVKEDKIDELVKKYKLGLL